MLINDWGFKIIEDSGRVVIEHLVREEFDCKVTGKMERRSVVFVLCKNNAATILLYLRCICKRIIPVMLSGMIKSQELYKLLNNYYPSYIWVEKSDAKTIYNGLVVGEFDDYYLMKIMWNEDQRKNYEIYEELALLLPTSGSTGSSKMVRISYKNIESNTNGIIKSLNIKENDVAPLVLPISYTYALSIINTYYKAGATIIVTNYKLYMNEFWERVNKYRITSFSGVPYTYEMLVKLNLVKDFPSTLKVMTVAGGMLDSFYLKKMYDYSNENYIKFYVMYGQTEATARISVMELNDDIYFNRIDANKFGDNSLFSGCIGKVLEGLDYKIKEDGELVIYGDSVSLGYAVFYGDLIRGDDNKGILNTNDIVFEKEGYLYWLGRKDRYVKVCGNRIDLNLLEMTIKEKFLGYQCLCKQIKENEITILTDFGDKEQVLEYITSVTELNKMTLNVKVVEEFPRKENGKLEYGES